MLVWDCVQQNCLSHLDWLPVGVCGLEMGIEDDPYFSFTTSLDAKYWAYRYVCWVLKVEGLDAINLLIIKYLFKL